MYYKNHQDNDILDKVLWNLVNIIVVTGIGLGLAFIGWCLVTTTFSQGL